MNKKYSLLLSVLFIAINVTVIKGQTDTSASQGYVTIIPDSDYAAGGLYRFIFGDHWRDVWTQPVRVPILDLDKFAGGIVPYAVGGGQQTKSLKFNGNDGRRWKFRSIVKDPSKLLPEEFHKTFVESILQDQMSSANPYAAIVVSDLLNAVDIMQAIPTVYIMPDDPKLGEFRETFAGMLGTIELHPDEAEAGEPGFVETDKIKGTFKLIDDLENKRNDKIDPKEFLKARLMDVLIGDWDRHADQWRWARFREKDWDWWRPIPRDRDQAFAKFDGAAPKIAEYVVPQITSFGYDYPNLKGLTWNGRHIDKRFLTELDKQSWDSIAVNLQKRITDSVIVHAVKRLPKDVYEIAGDELIGKLKSRRDKMLEMAQDYYELVNRVAYVFATNKEDYAAIDRIDDLHTSVNIFEYEKEMDLYHGRPYFSKVFENDITKEIRIFMLDNEDKAVVTGEVNSSPLIRVIGGEGKDIFVDSSKVKGYFLSLTPIPSAENKTKFYDDGKKTEVIKGAGTSYDDAYFPVPADIEERLEPSQIYYGGRWLFVPYAGYNSDDEIKVGGEINYYGYDFRKIPYSYRHKIKVLYASRPNTFQFEYDGQFIDVWHHVDFHLKLMQSELSFTRYYGFGNETPVNEDLIDNDYYRLDQEYVTVLPEFKFKLTKSLSLFAGVFYEYNKSSLNTPSLLNTFKFGDYGIGSLKSYGSKLETKIDTRDNESFPLEGYMFDVEGRYYLDAADLDEDFFRLTFDLRKYHSFNLFRKSTLALRTGGGRVWGTYPFYHAMFLGGDDNLRGFTRERFSGDGSVFAQAALRSNLSELKIIIKGEFGVNVFAETGRVFTEGSSSDKWHNSIGGSIWISYLERALIVSFSFAHAPDENNIYLDTSMAF